jgi:hypothetical protein
VDARGRNDSGQGTVEWIGIVFLVALLLGAALAAAGNRVPGGALARAIAGRILCAARLSDSCGAGDDAELTTAYGDELAALVGEHAPRIRYERRMEALPVDYRSCREDACSRGAPTGEVWRSSAGEPVAAFVHVVDCRAAAAAGTERAGGDCSGPREGNLYLQYCTFGLRIPRGRDRVDRARPVARQRALGLRSAQIKSPSARRTTMLPPCAMWERGFSSPMKAGGCTRSNRTGTGVAAGE